MAYQNHQRLRDLMDRQEFIESFIELFEASCEEKKMHEFDSKFSVSQIQNLVKEDLGMAVLEDLALSSTLSSSFQLLCKIITHLQAKYGHGRSEQDLPPVWRDLIKKPVPPLVTKEPSKASLGSVLEKSMVNLGGHGEQTRDLSAAITNSYHSHYLSSTISNSSNSRIVATPNLSISPIFPDQLVDHNRPDGTSIERDSVILNMPMIPSEPSPHEDTKLGFTFLPVELLGALSNFAVSAKTQEHQILIYTVVISCTIAFLLSSTALMLHRKRPVAAKWMQKAAFVFGAFGFLGAEGMHFPPSIMWAFTIPAFLVFLLMFTVTTLM